MQNVAQRNLNQRLVPWVTSLKCIACVFLAFLRIEVANLSYFAAAFGETLPPALARDMLLTLRS